MLALALTSRYGYNSGFGAWQSRTAHGAGQECSASYAIFRRLNTGTLAKSRMMAKAAAATSISPTTNSGSRVMAIPQTGSADAIDTSITDDPISQGLGHIGRA